MRVIRLTHGTGNGVNEACLLTATSMLVGRPKELDKTSCVCPTLRSFIAVTNDGIPIDLLRELYGPLMWEIAGTKTDDPEVLRRRGFAWADWAVREIAPLALGAVGSLVQAERLRGLRPIVDAASASSAADAAYAAANAAYAAANAANRAANRAADAAYAAANAAAHTANLAANAAANAANLAAHTAANAAAHTANLAANAAAHTANRAAYAAGDAGAAWRLCPDIIRRVASIGDRRPVEAVLTIDQLADKLA